MSEMRFNPILGEWVVTATHRQDRTFLPPEGYCPLCPTKPGGIATEVSQADYDFVVFENKFPSLRRHPTTPEIESGSLYDVRPSTGVCEVVLYTPEHNATLAQLSVGRVAQLVHVWKDRYIELGKQPEIQYVFIFENKGEAIGVTLHHPHGQIYAFPFIPPRIRRQIDNENSHFKRTGHCLHCDIIAEEGATDVRMVVKNERFVAFVPFFARFPYEVHIYARRHIASLAELSSEDELSLAEALHAVLGKYDNLWGISMPYMMFLHQMPTDGGNYPGAHFRIEFNPPLRTATKLKYLAGCETGAGTFINDTLPEDTARQLREAGTSANQD